jgi:predicted nucleotidyltransferase
VYRRIAAGAGRWLGGLDGVETVFVRRSVASGEATFPRSDIDITVVVHDPTPHVVAAVADRVVALRRVLPVLGEAILHDAEDLVRWTHLDTYRGSIDRRAALPVHGPAPAIPRVSVSVRDALWRLAFWLDTFLPRALARGNRVNLRKFALEAVGAHAVAVGELGEPPLTRAQALTLPAARLLPEDHARPEDWLRAFFDVLGDAHNAARPAVEPLRPGEHSMTWPDSGRPARLVALDSPGARPPATAGSPDALIVTAEALDLLVSCVNPALWWALPDPLRTSVARPEADALRHLALVESSLWRLCAPGLHGCRADEPARHVALAVDLAEGAAARPGWTPPEPASELIPASKRDYYVRVYPRLRAQVAEVAALLGQPLVERSAV